ncbi:MAG: RNA-binding transcriptional accessory protein [Anaerolineaceae bacterium]|nr:RNA-binding transcriptional accessory protein [Anaerolineaceae bacterium]
MTYVEKIASETQLKQKQISAVIELLDQDNTIPFIARYRKEMTGSMDEEQIRLVSDRIEKLRAMDKRRTAVLKSIEEQGKLSPELSNKLNSASNMTELEDLYQPYKRKRKTRASIAKEKGLQGLSELIVNQSKSNQSIQSITKPYINDKVTNSEEALAGARDIVAETISDHSEIRRIVREKAKQWATIVCKKINKSEDERGIFENYYDFEMRVNRLKPHQIMAINRGEREKVLRVQIIIPERDWRDAVLDHFYPDHKSPLYLQMKDAIDDAADRLLLPAIERDVRRHFSEGSEDQSIQVFASNLRALLSQPPLNKTIVMGIDPGYRSGCKAAVVDITGKVLDTATIYPHKPQSQWNESLQTLQKMIDTQKVNLISIGNGTASRETEQLIAELTKSQDDLHYLITNEAGASVYSASPLARKEFPDMDVSMRGAVSIARRVQDPLAELVKIDPKSIGVGMYQHDVNQTSLEDALDAVVESVVNQVGVDVNTASAALLTHVAGIGPKLAERIVSYRDGKGAFTSRMRIQDVPGLGAKAFEQAAGFLRIREGQHVLDASAIHPESYSIAETIMQRAGINSESSLKERETALKKLQEKTTLKNLAEELNTGLPTLQDIFEQLIRPGRDPRESLPAPILRSDVLSMEDLSEGLQLKGTVRNVVDFGAFVDIGVKQDGLLHRSKIPAGTRLKVGDVIDVSIERIEKERGRIGLNISQ